MISDGDPMEKVEHSMYVVYPAALLDGWEVVKEHDDEPVRFELREEAIAYAKARAALEGAATIKLENWYGNMGSTLEVQPRSPRRPGTAGHP